MTAIRDNNPGNPGVTLQQALFLLLISTIALGFLRSPGTVDIDTFMQWANEVLAQGIANGYRSIGQDYPPLTAVYLYGLGKASQLLGLDLRLAFKLSLYVCLLTSTFIYWRWTKDLLWAAIFELTLILSSLALGYTDVVFTPTLLLSLWALQTRKWVPFTLLYGTTCLIKWQPIIIAPFLLIYVTNVSSWHNWRQVDIKRITTHILLPALIVTLLLFAVFGWEIYRAFERASSDELLSGNALNLNWIITHYLRQFHNWFGGLNNGLATWVVTKDPQIIALPKLLFVVSFLAACYLLGRRPKTFENLIFYSLLGYLGYFMFNTGVHENHLYTAAVLAALLYAVDQQHATTYAVCAVAANVNLLFFYGVTGQSVPFNRVVFIDIALPLSALFLGLYLALWILALRQDTRVFDA